MSHTSHDESKKIPIGSGNIYVMEYTGTIPDDATIETEANRLGHVKGGASLEYTPTFYNAEDDFKRVKKTIITGEEAKLKFGLITWNLNVLKKLSSTATVSEDLGKRKMKLGGIANFVEKKYVFRFLCEDKTDGDMRITVVGDNQGALSLTFNVDKENAINPEISATPLDSDGTLVIIEEEVLTAGE